MMVVIGIRLTTPTKLTAEQIKDRTVEVARLAEILFEGTIVTVKAGEVPE